MELTRISLVDDLDGVSVAAETVTFELDKVKYEIDLTARHARGLREFMGVWVRHARRIQPHPSSSLSKPRTPKGRIYPIGPRHPGPGVG
ncbi:Lsr2 dimerization domain-containing protein [Nocardia miyunensis]|uniref:Lsr2 dimerization domain-containing protein n=1 Tax=Nocardia miyunensis TaxID=282684 RepID=UPI00082AF5BE|nr:histone-like nucleoid-structuring protein Lsr2 [Nocardia miyunensis]